MNNKKIFIGFLTLLLLAMIPLSFTKSAEPFIFGWLPATLLYWWVLMIINLIFVLWVAKKFVDKEKQEEDKNEL